MQDSFDPLTIIFLALAVFIIWKLRSVLGQRTGSERPPYDPFTRKDAAKPDEKISQPDGGGNVIHLPGSGTAAPASQPSAERWMGIAEKDTPIAAALDSIASVEPQFDAKQFLEGAKSAYETIVLAFSRGDRITLKSLLSQEVYEGFERVIAEREKEGQRAETTFVAISQPVISDAEVNGKNAQLTLRFTSKLIAATRNRAGEVVDGDPEGLVDVTDVWTFARTLGSRDPNWRLVATEAAG